MKSFLGCEMWPQVTTEDGTKVDSDLYKSIYHLLGNKRDLAVKLYLQATSPSFMSDFQDKLSLNSQGEPTLDSLLDIDYFEDQLAISKDEQVQNISKEYEGVYDLGEALDKIDQFSQQKELKNKFIPQLTTITQGEHAGKVYFSITKNDSASVTALQNYVTQAKFKQRLLSILRDAGVDVGFAEKLIEKGNVDGVYNTKSPEKVLDSLYRLIDIATNNKVDEKITRDLCHEIGHFIVGAAEHSSDNAIKDIYQRLARISGTQFDLFKEGLLGIRAYNDRNSSLQAKADEIEGTEIEQDLAEDEREYLGQYIGEMLYSLKFSNNSHFDVSKTPKKVWGIFRLLDNIYRWAKAKAFNIGRGIGNYFIDRSNRRAGRDHKINEQNLPRERFKYENYKDATLSDISRDVRRLVNTFLDGELHAEDAILTQETRNKESLYIVDRVNSLARSLNSFITKYKDRGGKKEYVKAMEDSLAESLQKRGWYRGGLEVTTIQGEMECIGELLEDAISIMEDILEDDLQSVQDPEFLNRIKGADASKLSRVHSLNKNLKATLNVCDFTRTFNSITSILQHLRTDRTVNDLWDNNKHLVQLLKDFNEAGKRIADVGAAAVFELDSAILQTVNQGNDYIKIEAGLVRKFIDANTVEYVGQDDQIFTIKELLSNFEFEDLGFISTWLNPISRSTDIISQLHEQLVNYNKAEQNRNLIAIKRSMFDLRNYMRSLSGMDDSFDWMCETYEEDIKDAEGNILHRKGSLTGNIWQPRLWGKWEAEFDRDRLNEQSRILKTDGETYIRQFDKKFKDLNPYEKKQYVKQQLDQYTLLWHSEHSIMVEEDDPDIMDPLYQPTANKNKKEDLCKLYKYKPNDSYINKKWAESEMNGTKKDLINRYLNIKRQLDRMVNNYRPNATRFYRLPQMRGTTMNRIYNKIGPNNWYNAGVETIATNFSSAFFEDCLDSDFGDLTCYTTEDQTIDATISERFAEWRRRLPVYGINKLPDGDMSTDLIYSTMAYAVMATNVDAMNTASLVSQLGEEALRRRTIKNYGNTLEQDLNANQHTNVFNRYSRWMDMEVFNKYQTRAAWSTWTLEEKNKEQGIQKRKFLINKFLSKLNGAVSTIILAGRIPGATVNLGTGLVQIFKEANVREHFGSEDLYKALLIYLYGVGKQSLVDEFGKGGILDDITHMSFGKAIAELPSAMFLHKNLDYRTNLYTFIEWFDAQNKNMQRFQEMHSRVPAWLRTQYGMWVYEVGDHMMQTIPYLAKALSTKLYTTDKEFDPKNPFEDSDMKPAGNIYEAFDSSQINNKSGQASSEQRDPYKRYERPLYIKDSEGKYVQWDSIQENIFMEQCRGIVDDLHGVYNSKDMAALSQNIIGSMMLTMKKYYIGYMNGYWLGQQYSVANKHRVQGAYDALKYLWGYNMQQYRHDVRDNISAGDSGVTARIKSAKKNLFRQESALAVPVVASGIAGLGSFLGSSFLKAAASNSSIAFGIYAAYSILSKSFLGFNMFGHQIAKDRTDKIRERTKMSVSQINALRRADANVKKFLFLQMLSHFFAMGIFKLPNDDEKNKKKNNKAVEDAQDMIAEEESAANQEKLKKLLVPDLYVANMLFDVEEDDYIKTALKYAKGEHKDKIGGMAYNLIMRSLEGDKESQFKWHTLMGGFYYIAKRLELEQATLSPMMFFDSTRGVTEVKTQISELSRVLPVSMSFILQQWENLNTLNEEGDPKFKYNKNLQNFSGIDSDGDFIESEEGRRLRITNSEDWDVLKKHIFETSKGTEEDKDGNEVETVTGGAFFGLIPYGENMGNLIMSLPGSQNKGTRNLYFMLPYGNSTKWFMDTYGSSENWYKGRTLGG